MKWMLIIVGFLAGIFFVGIQMLQKYGYVSAVNWDYLLSKRFSELQFNFRPIKNKVN
ncbi:MAG: hypothetical protein WA364_01480 [Candidatus Nitrosopolaris sp.]